MRNVECGMRIARCNQSGVTIIAAIFIIVVLSFMGVVFLSVFTSSSSSSLNEMQSIQAFFIAEGGLQYTLGLNKNNMPNYSTHGGWTNLGEGQFRVDTPAYLTADIAAGAATIPVDSTASFPAAGRITIGSDFGIIYTGKDATNFTGASGGQAHLQNNSVYPAAQLAAVIPNDPACASVTFTVLDDPGGFSIPGIIFIDTEYFYCTTRIGLQFQNCRRCYAGSLPAAHPQTRFASQYRLKSTGRVASFMSGFAERVVEINVGPYEE